VKEINAFHALKQKTEQKVKIKIDQIQLHLCTGLEVLNDVSSHIDYGCHEHLLEVVCCIRESKAILERM
jgi:hypothetical protein